MKTKVKEIAEAYALLDKAKTDKLARADCAALMKAMHAMKRVATDFEEFRRDVLTRLRPEKAEEYAATLAEFDAMTVEQRKEAVGEAKYAEALLANAEFEQTVSESLADEAAREVELTAPLREEAFCVLMESNPDWTLGQAMRVQQVLCETDNSEKSDN